MRVDLKKGRWAEIVDADDMTHGAKMKVQSLLPDEDNTEHWYRSELRMREMLIAQAVTNWSLDIPAPNGDPTLLADVPDSAYAELVEATKPHWDSLDFFRAGRTSSESKTDSTDTSSPGSDSPSEP
jgi:hypothetical protein